MPDTFGHISQLPQILKGFGIEDAFIGRGIDYPEANFIWESPDGSSIFTVNVFYCSFMVDGFLRDQWRAYNSGQELIDEVEKNKPEVFPPTGRQKFIGRALTNVLLLPNGFDHFDAQPQLPKVLKEANEISEEVEYVHSTLPDYIKEVKANNPELDVITGELRNLDNDWLLQGTFSSRIHLKQQNEECQNMLEKWVEPFCVFSSYLGDVYEEKLVEKSWELLLQNHPHDSICGCSADEVHREMEVRFSSSLQIAEALLDKSFRSIAKRINMQDISPEYRALVIFNSLQWVNKNVIIIEFELWEFWDLDPFILIDRNENRIYYEVIQWEKRDKFEKVEGYTPGYVKVIYYKIAIEPVGVPPCGYAVLKVKKGKPEGKRKGMITHENVMENELMRTEVNPDGALQLLDKETGKSFYGLHVFEDGGDVGDLYNYAYPPNDSIILSTGKKVQITALQDGFLLSSFLIEYELPLPVSAVSTRQSREKDTVNQKIRTMVTLRRNSGIVEFETKLKNRIKDHRLRILFPTY